MLALRRPGRAGKQHVGNRFGNRRVAARASGEKGCRDQSQTSSTRGRRESTTAQSEETRNTVTNRERAALDSIVEERRRIEVAIFEVGVESTGAVGDKAQLLGSRVPMLDPLDPRLFGLLPIFFGNSSLALCTLCMVFKSRNASNLFFRLSPSFLQTFLIPK